MNPRVTVEGAQIGALVARLAERGRRLLAAKGLDGFEFHGVRGVMCASCACRKDTVPNGCLQTQMDFLKSIVEGVPFLCHAPKDGRMCAGWVAARAAHVERPLPEALQDTVREWEFSPPDEEVS